MNLIGSVGIMFGDGVHSADMQEGDAEIGYWIGMPYWGQGTYTGSCWMPSLTLF